MSCFFECHDTRAGDVAADVLTESGCRYFLSDAFSGYGKAVREANDYRKSGEILDLIIAALCNAHARRNFKECISEKEEDRATSADANTFIAEYKIIYVEDKSVQQLLVNDFEEAAKLRSSFASNFERMKLKAEADLLRYSSHHNYYKACQYFLNNYEGLTACLQDPRIPLDNNISERGLRPHVVGRKTWYGTHSEKGAEAAAIHFTIIESCKLVGVNPREYYREMIEAIHYKKTLLTPREYKKNLEQVLAPPPPS
jgi:hypothetical protein